MGRQPTVNKNIPKGMRARKRGKKTYYYFDTGGKPRHEIPLGTDYVLAMQQWSTLAYEQKATASATFRYAAERYFAEVFPLKAIGTQKNNLLEIAKLYAFFDNPPAPLSLIEPIHIRQYMDTRRAAPYAANREKALFSHIWNKAREWGYTDRPNPCTGVAGYSEPGRDRYVTDSEFTQALAASPPELTDYLRILYLTGQRPADVLALTERDIIEGCVCFQQAKTGKRLRIEITGALEEAINILRARKRAMPIHPIALFNLPNGQRLTKQMVRKRFDDMRKATGLDFQMRDIRAKAGTDKADKTGMMDAQKLLGHEHSRTTDHYVKKRRGERVSPTC